jgi:hypothetical protein
MDRSASTGSWRRAKVVVAGVLGLCTVAAATVTATSTPASAATSAYTYQASGSEPGPLPTTYDSRSASDGWAAAVSATQVFNVSHHEQTLRVACHNQSDGSTCWTGTKTVVSGSTNFATPLGAGLFLNQSTGHLFAYVVRTSDKTAGVACIDTSLPSTATGAQMFCGFTALSAANDAYYLPPATAGAPVITGISGPVLVGTKWYASNQYPGSSTGDRNKLLCFDTSTITASVPGTKCAASPIAVDLGGQTIASFVQPVPIGSSGTSIYVQVAGTTADLLTCINTATTGTCTGSWPVTVASPAASSAVGGSPIPLLNTSGTPTGICLATASTPCFTAAGVPTSTPTGMASVIGAPLAAGSDPQLEQATGSPLIIGTSVYVPVSQSTKVVCYNFATSASCANFPKPLTGMLLLYTLNPDPLRPTCIWVNSNSGAKQIQSFDAVTGGACLRGPVRIQTNNVVNPNATCTPSSFSSLQITSPARASYSSASVAFEDALGNTLPVPAQPLDSFGSVSLSSLNLQSQTAYPQFVVTFSGLAVVPTTVSYKLTWGSNGYTSACISNGQSVSSIPGYWMVASDGGIFNYGNAGFYGSAGALQLNKPIVGMASLPCRCGYWLVASDGGIFSYGYAGFYGSTGALALNKPIVGMAVTPTGNGYWLVASDGGIFAFGDARFFGSTGAITLNKPIVGMAATQDGGGYWLVASDGGVFAYGDAAFYGSTGSLKLNKPIVSMASNPNGGGYWMVASDGGIFSFGNAGFYGSAGSLKLNKPIVGMAPTFDGVGYWLVASDGGIFSYGDAGFGGSAGGLHLNKPIVAMTA